MTEARTPWEEADYDPESYQAELVDRNATGDAPEDQLEEDPWARESPPCVTVGHGPESRINTWVHVCGDTAADRDAVLDVLRHARFGPLPPHEE